MHTKNNNKANQEKKMPDVKALLMFICLGLVCAILVLILINAIRRTFFFPGSRSGVNPNGGNGEKVKYVDLYSTSVEQLPTIDALPGMTALVDLGATNLNTGIYMLQNANSWIKVNVPEVGDCYHILRGASAGKQHKINASFIYEIQQPKETQIFDNEHLYQELFESTETVFIQPDIRMACHMTIASLASRTKNIHSFPVGRTLKIVNTSSNFEFTISNDANDADKIIVGKNSIRLVHLTSNISDPLAPYRFGASSPL